MSERKPNRESYNIPDEREMEALFDADQKAMRASDRESLRDHTKNAKRLLEQHGWVSTTDMNYKAEKGLWISILHSDYDVEFQQQALEKLQSAVEAGEAPKYQLAYLTDRVRRNTAQPQLFGVYPYIQNNEGELVPAPIEDEDHVEERWKEYGLEDVLGSTSFADHQKKMRGPYEEFLKEHGLLPGYTN